MTDRTDRARIHIKAVAEEMAAAQSPDDPERTQLFTSGMLCGLATAVRIIDGDTAEDAMGRIVTDLAAAVGHAYLNGGLGDPKDPA